MFHGLFTLYPYFYRYLEIYENKKEQYKNCSKIIRFINFLLFFHRVCGSVKPRCICKFGKSGVKVFTDFRINRAFTQHF